MATSSSDARSGLPGEREPPTMGKQLVNCITCGCESSAPFKNIPYQLWYIIYKMNMLFPPSVFSRVRVARSLVLHVCFVDRCLSFCPFSFQLLMQNILKQGHIAQRLKSSLPTIIRWSSRTARLLRNIYYSYGNGSFPSSVYHFPLSPTTLFPSLNVSNTADVL
jgi:hypothetical protein